VLATTVRQKVNELANAMPSLSKCIVYISLQALHADHRCVCSFCRVQDLTVPLFNITSSLLNLAA
jgi:hypothetical protein